MPHTPDVQQGDRREGEFAELFARKARTPLRGFLPGRRVWNAVGGSAAVALVIAGSVSLVSAADFGSGDSDKVTTAADGKSPREKSPAEGVEQPSVVPSPKAEDSGKKDPEIVYVPVSGGAGAGAAASAPQSTPESGSADTTAGSTAGQKQQSSSSTTQSTQSTTTNTDYLWSDGSVDSDTNDYWDQSTVTVKSTKPLSALKVVVSIDQTGGVASTGTWSSLGDKVSVSQAANSDQLAYVVTLKSGVTLAAGTYVLKFQYNHTQGRRDAGQDRYNVTATSTDSADDYLSGGF